MVSNITPGASGAQVLGGDPRASRPTREAPQQREQAGRADVVEMSGGAFAVARESVRAAVAQLQSTLALGQEAQSLFVNLQAIARSGAPDAQQQLDAALGGYRARTDSALSRGAQLAAGESISVLAEPGGEPIVIAGADLRLKPQPGAADLIVVPAEARADDADLAARAQRSLEAVQEAMAKLTDAARALEAHQGFLGAAEAAAHVRGDLDADSARLLALQVRQGLEAAGAGPIANVEPQAVLSLFRA